MNPKYAYHWTVVYEDGTKISQFQADGSEISFMAVDCRRAKEVLLEPTEPQRSGLAPIWLQCNLTAGERGWRCWQITQNAGSGELRNVRQLLQLHLPAGEARTVTLLIDPDGKTIMTTRDPNTIP